jgi:hypothetical protein
MSNTHTPTHRVYAVEKRANSEKGFWREIGAAWLHEDGDGFSIKLAYLPLNGADISVRRIKPQSSASESAG